MKIENLNFSVRTYNILKRARIDTKEQLEQMSDDELMCVRNLGKHSLDEIHEKLERYTMTNGDRIRAMTNEDLAEFLIIFNWDRDVSDFVCDMCAKKERHCGKDMDGACPISNMAAALMWLRHEARVDHDTE